MSAPIPGTSGCLKCALERLHISKNVQRFRLNSLEFTSQRFPTPVKPPWLEGRIEPCELPGTDGVFALTDGH